MNKKDIFISFQILLIKQIHIFRNIKNKIKIRKIKEHIYCIIYLYIEKKKDFISSNIFNEIK
jgi:hypothetical protein